MALIKCPECGTEVSDKAKTCPKCAYPIADDNTEQEVQTVEMTGKKYKAQVPIAWLLIIIGSILACTGSMWGVWTAVIGLVWLIIVKSLIWWHHE